MNNIHALTPYVPGQIKAAYTILWTSADIKYSSLNLQQNGKKEKYTNVTI